MITMIDALFATLRGLIADQTRDLKMAMAELANVAAERDSYKSGRADLAAVLATYSAERDKAAMERDNARRSGESKSSAQGLTLATLCDIVLGEDAQDRSDDALVRAASNLAAERDKLKAERDSANWSLSRAKESLRAAEQEVIEVEGASFDLRTVNARLVADLAAAMQRADTAEAILRAKA